MNFFGISDMPPLPAKPQHLVFFGKKTKSASRNWTERETGLSQIRKNLPEEQEDL